MVSTLSPNCLAALLESSAKTHSPILGRATHALILKVLPAPPPPFLWVHLVNTYSKLDLCAQASLVLRLAPVRTVVSWTALISGLVQNGHFNTALLQFRYMLRGNILPNDFTLPCAFKASAWIPARFVGEQVHAISFKSGLIMNCYVGCSAFDMYSKMGLLGESKKVFEEMPVRNIATWNAVVSNAVLDGRPEDGIKAFIRFCGEGGRPDSISFCVVLNACADMFHVDAGKQLHGLAIIAGFGSDVSVCNGMIDFYGKCKEVECAEIVFRLIEKKNVVSWNSIVAVFELNNEEEKACLTFLKSMEENVPISDFMVSSVISAIAEMAVLDLGRSVHAISVKVCGKGNIFVGSALVDMYGKCGSIQDCQQSFFEMPDRNLVTWNALISGYSHQGRADVAVLLLEEMTREVIPNYVTFVCVLSACSRGGAVESGLDVFASMKERYDVEARAEHYACIVDMLSRAGMVQRAYDFIQKMPINPTISIWGALLNACRVHGNPDLGQIAAYNLFKLDPKDSGNHVLLSNMLAAAGRWDEAKQVRQEMREVGIKKGVGCSWITAKNKIHIFQSKDTSHERNSEIQEILAEMTIKLKLAGYVPDVKYALYDLDEEEKITEVGYHSEKIALAFGFLVIPHGVPIRITKNMRICGDCHSAFKLISGLYGREIIVRDNNRFHRFCDFQCTCKDYW